MNKDDELIDLSNDFSFTFEEDSDKFTDELNLEIDKYQKKISDLMDAISKLLNNLKRDPDKSVIKWPNRLSDIEKFEKKIRNIIENE